MTKINKIICIVAIFLSLEIVLYLLVYAISPLLLDENFHIYEYSMAIIYSDFNKYWMSYILSIMVIKNSNIEDSKVKYLINMLLLFMFFIGINIIVSDIIFISNRFGKIFIKSIDDFQKYYGVFIYFVYGLIYIGSSVLLSTRSQLYKSQDKSDKYLK